jgi:hypothetical protein
MARNALLSALQAAMLAGAGGVQGSIQAREREKKDVERQRELETQALRDALLSSQTELGQKQFGLQEQQFGLQQQQFKAQYSPEALERQERVQRQLAVAPTQAAAGSRAADTAAEQKRIVQKQEKDRFEGYQSLKSAGVPVPEPFNPNYRYEDEWAQYIKLSPFDRGATVIPSLTRDKPRVPGAAGAASPAGGSTFKSGNKTFILPE